MKIMVVLGTRPEIIRLSVLLRILDRRADVVLVHTGQNFDDRLDGLFFRELQVRAPDYKLDARGPGFGSQVGQILEGVEKLIIHEQPDRLLILGDTNSGLSAIVSRRLGIPVFHMEAGNRCFDDRVPEEVNRRIIDHSSTLLLPYTERSRENLLAEGIQQDSVIVTGNPIKQVIDAFEDKIASSDILKTLSLEPREYFLVTMHRAENVDSEATLRSLVDALEKLHARYGYPVICSLHPRTRSKIEAFGVSIEQAGLRFLEPFGFFDFIQLERSAFCVLTDSGTVQEETCIMHVPNVTIRDCTERPETVECGSNLVVGTRAEGILPAVALVTSRPTDWIPPAEYMLDDVAEFVVSILTSSDQAGIERHSALNGNHSTSK